ncbi:MAG: esterase family protein [Rhizobacter sp.]|nr:esterase family protein [Chlorobiales bacterium]
MNTEYHKWFSPHLHRDMELLVFGQGGVPVIVFPTSYARFGEWQDNRMIEWLTDKIDAQHIQIFCPDSIGAESWYNRQAHPHDRAVRHNQWEYYLMHELYPFIRYRNGNHFTVVAGASFGAYLAMNFALKHPHYVNKVIALSGGYGMVGNTNGGGMEVYFNAPLAYVPNLHNHDDLERIRQIDFKLVTSDWDIDVCRRTTLELSQKLWDKNIWHQCDVWGNHTGHDWPFWREMIRVYL